MLRSHPCYSGPFLQDGRKHRYIPMTEIHDWDIPHIYISSCCSMQDSIPVCIPADIRSYPSSGYTNAAQRHPHAHETAHETTPPSSPTTTAPSASELGQLAMSLLHKRFHACEATPSAGHFPPEAELSQFVYR